MRDDLGHWSKKSATASSSKATDTPTPIRAPGPSRASRTKRPSTRSSALLVGGQNAESLAHHPAIITGANPDRFDAVKAAASAEWGFEDWDEFKGTLTASADDTLGGGESEEEFAARLAKAVWTANGGPCEVEVRATYLEDLPYEAYVFDASDYERIVTHQGEQKNGQ